MTEKVNMVTRVHLQPVHNSKQKQSTLHRLSHFLEAQK